MSSYFISDQARSDLGAIWNRIAQDSASRADNVLGRVKDSFVFLAANPINGDPWPSRVLHLRVFAVPSLPISVFFVPHEDGVRILRVAYGGLNLDALKLE
jgi:plasmid stabilization system protein ParE